MELPKDLKELDTLSQQVDVQKQLVIKKSMESNDPHEIMKAQSYFADLDKQTDKNVKSYLYDPFSFSNSLGYKDRPVSLTYDTLRQMGRMYVIRSIIETRKDQVARFCDFTDDEQKEGWTIRRKREPFMEEKDMKMSKDDKKKARDIAKFILNAGTLDNKWSRDDFETFLRKTVNDSMVLDQMCLLAGQYIELYDSTPVKIEDIESGMKVRTHTGSIKNVIKPTQRLYSGNIINIKVRGQKLHVTEGHPIFAAKKISLTGNKVELDKPDFVAAKDLNENYYLAYPKYKCENKNFKIPIFVEENRRKLKNIDKLDELINIVNLHPKNVKSILGGIKTHISKERQEFVLKEAEKLDIKYVDNLFKEPETLIDKDIAYMMGLYVSEGYIPSKLNLVSFTFHSEEIEYLSFIERFGEKYGIKTAIIPRKGRNGVSIYLFSRSIAKFLFKHCNRLSNNLKIPYFILNAKEEIRNEFLKGYFQGDSYIMNNSLAITTTSKQLFYGLRMLLSIDNIYLSESFKSYEQYGWNNQYGSQISGIFYRKLAKKLNFPVIDEDVIVNRVHCDDNYLYLKIEKLSIEKVDNIMVYNMEVEDDHSYIAEGFINHNCYEVVGNRRRTADIVRNGRGEGIVEFFATDGGTYRLADTSTRYTNQAIKGEKINGHYPTYVQVYQNQIVAEFYPWELSFGIRNQNTSITNNGYGISELEDLINIVTWMLNSDNYNANFFKNGSNPKGILRVSGNVSEPMLNQFKQAWYNQIVGVSNAWKIPVIQQDKMDWIDLQKNNTDMQFHLFSQYLRLIACALYKMDPVEVGFRDETQGNSLFQGNQDKKFENSKEKGLEPLLKFWGKNFNKSIVSELTEEFEFAFTGVTPDDEQAALEADIKKVANIEQLNETRKRRNLPPLKDGDIVLNAAYMQWKQMQAMGSPDSNAAIDEETGDSTGNAYAGESDNPFENIEASVKDQINNYTKELIQKSRDLNY